MIELLDIELLDTKAQRLGVIELIDMTGAYGLGYFCACVLWQAEDPIFVLENNIPIDSQWYLWPCLPPLRACPSV